MIHLLSKNSLFGAESIGCMYFCAYIVSTVGFDQQCLLEVFYAMIKMISLQMD